MIYQVTMPPVGQACSTPGDGTLAVVRVITPREHFEADGVDHDGVPAVFDQCEYCWAKLLDTYRRMGHQVIDTSASLDRLTTDFPHWRIFYSDEGRLYASARLHGSQQGTTVHAWTVAALRGEMEQAERRPVYAILAPIST